MSLTDELDELIESAKLLGRTEARKENGCYTPHDSRFRTSLHESISKHRSAIEAAVREELAKQEPVAWWCERYFDDEEEAQNYCDTKAQIAESITPLYAAPVVQPDMVMVPMEPTEAMIDAAMNRYKHVSPEAKARYTKMHRENFRCDYRAMIAEAEKE